MSTRNFNDIETSSDNVTKSLQVCGASFARKVEESNFCSLSRI